MRRVGNDVVDLEDPAIAQTHLRERFVVRVCAPSERALLAASTDPKITLWSLFAAKEAAFKAVSKDRQTVLAGSSPDDGSAVLRLAPPLVFAHSKFVVTADFRSVGYEKYVLWLKVEVDGPCVHAIAWTDDEQPIFGVEQIGPDVDPSAAARALLVKRLGVPGLTIEREPKPGSWNGFGPPKLFRDGVEVNLDISLSHDGRFVGFAADSSGAEKR